MDKQRMLRRAEVGWLTRSLLVRRSKGQAIVILALALGVLLTLAGLVYDLGMMRLQGAKMQRAADAASLAGVIFMPENFAPGRPQGNATDISRDTALRNGYRNMNACSPINHPRDLTCVIPEQMPVNVRLKVSVYAPYTSTFMGLIGFRDLQIRRESIAEYNQPILMGSPEAYIGIGKGLKPNGFTVNVPSIPVPGGANDTSGGAPERIEYPTTRPQNFWISLHWAGTDKSYGDPFVVKYNCRSNGGLCNDPPNDQPNLPPTSYQVDYDNGQVGAGYNFAIDVATSNGGQLRIFDAGFAVNPSPNAVSWRSVPTLTNRIQYDTNKGTTWCQSNSPFLGDNVAVSPGLGQENGAGNLTPIPVQVTVLPTTTETIYVPRCRPGADPGKWELGVRQLTTTFELYYPDGTPYYFADDVPVINSRWDVGPVQYRETTATTVPASDYNRYDDPDDEPYHNKWVNYNTRTTNPTSRAGYQPYAGAVAGGALGQYNGYTKWRLNVNTNRNLAYENGKRVDVPGQNNMSMVLAGAIDQGAKIAAFQRLPVYVTLPAGESQIYLAEVPATAKKKVMDVRLFDPGDVAANTCTIQLLHPPDSTHTNPYVQDNLTVVVSPQPDRGNEQPTVIGPTDNYLAKNGANQYGENRWIDMIYRLPVDYEGGYWRVSYQVDGQATDRTTWMVTLRGNPVHLVLDEN